MITLAPSSVPSAPGLECAGADFDAAVIAEILSWPEIGGVAEVMNMRGVIDGDPRMTGIVNAGLASGKIVAGHARGLEGADLNAFMAAGVTSDHELTSGADFLAKLSAGMTIELRGSHDYLLTQFVNEIKNLGHMPQTITLCTDDVFPDELHRDGGLDDVVRRLVRDGLRQVGFARSNLNAAMRLNRPDLGLIAPVVEPTSCYSTISRISGQGLSSPMASPLPVTAKRCLQRRGSIGAIAAFRQAGTAFRRRFSRIGGRRQGTHRHHRPATIYGLGRDDCRCCRWLRRSAAGDDPARDRAPTWPRR